MEHYIANEKQERKIEHFVLIFFTAYSFLMSYVGISHKWDAWVIIIIGLSLVTAWALFLMRYKTYAMRALFTTLLILLCFFLYAILSKDFINIIPPFFIIGAVISMYAITDLIVITNIVQIFLLVIFVVEGKQNMQIDDFHQALPQIANIFIYIVLLQVWVRQKNVSSAKSMQIIQDMARAERSKDDFLANISHEIRTPLNTIYGMSEMAQKQTDLNVIKEEIYNIQVASKKLMSMVNDILDFSELQTGEMDLEEEVYNISSTINDVINMTMAAVEEKDLDVVVDFDTTIPALLEGDEKKIRRIIMNLVSNAVKFTHSGYIGIKVGGRRESYGINLSISITDTGIGMREDYRENLFIGFGQLDNRRNRQEGGVGLGLAISYLLAKKLGGVITVNSKEGQGSVFTFVVPQKIVKDQPVAVLKNADEISIACYFNIEHQARPGSRDAFTTQIENMVKNIPVSWQLCKNLDEMKRRMKAKHYTHVLITDVEYEEDPHYFDAMALRTKLMISVPRNAVTNRKYENALIMYRPVYSLSVVAALNEEYDSSHADKPIKSKRFTAPGAHVLVVDDNIMNIRVIENILSQFKISVTKALSGSEALEKVESMDFDFIFMDHMMPEMDGVETTHRIREKVGSYYQRVPIIALTANAVAGSRKMFLSEGFSDFLEKPVELSVLERVLRRTLPPEKMIFDDAEDTVQQQETTDSFELTEIDKETGMLYCGGEEGFYMILAECVLDYKENAALLTELFQKKDWENYVIKIHALKSTMKSIGAMRLSDRARELEFAGKECRYEVIEKYHQSVLNEYENLMEQLKKQEYVNKLLAEESSSGEVSKEQPVDSRKQSLTIETFDTLYAKFEDAMYSLRKEEMLDIVEELGRYKIGENTKKSELDKISRKINQDDYFAAGYDLEVLRKDLKGGN